MPYKTLITYLYLPYEIEMYDYYVFCLSNMMPMYRGRGTGGAGGARAPPRIEVLQSKNFQNWENFIFRITRAPLGKNSSQAPVYECCDLTKKVYLQYTTYSILSSQSFSEMLEVFKTGPSWEYACYSSAESDFVILLHILLFHMGWQKFLIFRDLFDL